jgi:hypothetical protein
MLSDNSMNTTVAKSNKKSEPAADIVALHAVATLPDSLTARRRILWALLAACSRSRYAERISVMLEHLEQHQACAATVLNSTLQENE